MTPQVLQQVFESAMRAHQAGRLEDAAAHYRQFLGMQPGHVGALSNFALLLAELGDRTQAEALLRDALARDPAALTAHVNLALVLHDEGKFDAAIAACLEGLQLSPGHRKLSNLLASSYRGAERYEEGAALLRAMVAAHPGYAEGQRMLAAMCLQLGRIEEAAQAFAKAAKADPRDVESLVSSGDAMLVLGRAKDALAQLDRALKLKPYDVKALALKLLALADLDRRDEERWLGDPDRLVHRMRITELGYPAEDIPALNRRLSEWASADPSMREDPPEYATAKGWHSTTNLAESDFPAVAELKTLIMAAYRRRLEGLAEEDPAHPFVKAVPRDVQIDMWAVKMSDSGKMLPHIHSSGWLSGVYYVDVPSIVNDPAGGEAGWIKFGPARLDVKLRREPIQRTLRPEPGLMVTFPSYLWHDTVPLPPDNREQRLCLAYDLHPVV